MRKLSKFNYHEPSRLDEVYELLIEHDTKAKVLAGGTDLIIKNKKRSLELKEVINLKAVKENLKTIIEGDSWVTIGSMATMTEVAQNAVVQKNFPALAGAAGRLGSPLVRNIATIGGNAANASPAGETLSVLLALDAQVLCGGKEGTRKVPMREFCVGVEKTSLGGNELVLGFEIPTRWTANAYRRFSPRKSMDLAMVGITVALVMDGNTINEASLGLGAVAVTPIHAQAAEDYLVGKSINEESAQKAGELAADAAKPISDIRASAEYRKHLVSVLTKRLLLSFVSSTPSPV